MRLRAIHSLPGSRLRRPPLRSSEFGNLSACTRSLVPQTAKIIPRIFRIIAVRGPPGQ
jgi:hypothetical protein